MADTEYKWTDNPTESGKSPCDTDVLNDCLMHLKYNAGGGGRELFDIVQKDHILNYEETQGYELLGNYVYKTPVAGSRYGYPDFYNKCLEEYNNSNNTYEILRNNYEVVGSPTITEDGVATSIGGQNYVYIPPIDYTKPFAIRKIGFTYNQATSNATYFINGGNTTSDWGGFVFGANRSSKKLRGFLGSTGTSWDIMAAYEFQTILSTNTVYYMDLVYSGSNYTIILYDNNLNELERKVVNNSTPLYQSGNGIMIGSNFINNVFYDGKIYLTNITIENEGNEIYRMVDFIATNTNGHRYYPISCKSFIDSIYEQQGTAWFYGIDTTNERVLLPRCDYVELTTKDKVPVVGNGMALGLTNGTNNGAPASTGDGNQLFRNNYGQAVGSATGSNVAGNGAIGVTTDSKNSGIETDLSTYSSKKYYYMVVGNTEVESAITDFIDVTTSENDTIPLFHNFWSKEDMTTTGCYVNASLGSWLSGNVYTTAYNTLVGKLGTGNIKSVSDNYTDYDFVVNADNMTFRLPLKNGQEIMFATGVKGNGYTIGVTNGSVNFAMGTDSNNVVKLYEAEYGKVPVPTAISSTASKGTIGLVPDSTKSGIRLDTENITIPEGWNLYYKVSNVVQNIELLDVAGITADLNTKISKEECPRYVVEVSDKSLLPSWYVVYNDGWCEQGGLIENLTSNSANTVNLLKDYMNLKYFVIANGSFSEKASTSGADVFHTAPLTTSTFNITHDYSGTAQVKSAYWEAKGYIK